MIAHLYRAIAGNRPGVISSIGLHTFVEPRYDGGKLNRRTAEDLVELVTLRGQENPFYPAMPIDCVLLRGTTADADGNISMEEEVFHNDVLALAQAAHNSGGIVVAQAKRLAAKHAIHPHAVRVRGILVDYVVVAERPEDHWQTNGEAYNPAYVGATRAAPQDAQPLPLDPRKIVQRRAVLELLRYQRPIVNLGVGMSAGVGQVAREEGLDDFVMTLESGPIGGTPAQCPSFGASANPDAVVSHGEQFDFCDGGGLDLAFLGLAQVSFNGAHSAGSGTRVLSLTERAVFEMRGGRLTVTEIAPGIDLEREVRAQIAPGVAVAEDLKTMDARIFHAQPMLRRP